MLQTAKNLHKSFYDSLFYRELAYKRTGIGFGFLLFATLIGLIQVAIAVVPVINVFLDEQPAIFESLPTMTIQSGKISMEGGPREIVFLKNVEEGNLKIIIDTKADPLDPVLLTKKMADERIFAYVAKDGITMLDPRTNTLDTKEARELKDQVIAHEQWKAVSAFLSHYTYLIFFITMAMALLFAHLLTAFLGAVFLLIIAPLFKVDPSFAGTFRIASAAKVPVAVIFLFLMPYPIMKTLVWFGFAVFGLVSLRKALETAPH